MKAYGGTDLQIHIFLTSALDGDELSASRPGRFTPPRGKSRRYPLDRRLDGPQNYIINILNLNVSPALKVQHRNADNKAKNANFCLQLKCNNLSIILRPAQMPRYKLLVSLHNFGGDRH
jgi:hypothetical protein